MQIFKMPAVLFVLFLVRCLAEVQDLPPLESSPNDAPSFPSSPQDPFASSPNDVPPFSSSLAEDTCDYTQVKSWKCGDSCIHQRGDCYCGISGQIESNQHCCIPPGSECFNVPGSKYCDQAYNCDEFESTSVVCSDGFALPSTIPCNTTVASQKCPNTYSESLFLGYYVHYACPKMCIPEVDYCQGISWCVTDTSICGPELRCSTISNARNLNSNVAPNHHYCDSGNSKHNDHTFDEINRFDEEEIGQDGSALDIDVTKFTPCSLGGLGGVNCDGLIFPCILCIFWCNKGTDYTEVCADGTNTDDWRLCSNPKVWENVKCIGRRCTGNNMRCSTPWYTQPQVIETEISDSCEDKSDQVIFCIDHIFINPRSFYKTFPHFWGRFMSCACMVEVL